MTMSKAIAMKQSEDPFSFDKALLPHHMGMNARTVLAVPRLTAFKQTLLVDIAVSSCMSLPGGILVQSP